MAKDSPVTITLRLPRTTRDLLKQAATFERRSMANMVEVLILKHCEERGTSAIPTPAKRPRSKTSVKKQ